MNRLNTTAALFLILLSSNTGYAAQRIAILDFELNDITSLPNNQAERIRTASMQPLLEQAISRLGDYHIVRIPLNEQKTANAGIGYLFRFHDVAAHLGKKFAADWIIVSLHSKPSFLESSLIADVIDVQTANLVEELYVDLKGNHAKVTGRAIKELARKVNQVISPQKKSHRQK